jgi:Protein of unknown function (DUF3662)/FHA domain
MSVLRAIESRIEGLFEGVFGRAFRSHVQPVELARKLAKEMDEQRSVSVSRVYVPNEYTVYLSPGDRAQFSAYEGSLVGELQEYLSEHARREAYALLTPPRVLLETDSDLAIGEFGIATRVAQPEEPAPHPRHPEPVPVAAPASTPIASASEPVAPTMIYRPEPEPEPHRETVTLTLDGRTVPLAADRAVVGRSRECDIRLEDANVSRRHAELERGADAGWSIVDLGSTNGTEVNGRRITRRTPLEDGDRIAIGGTELVFGREAR